MTTAIVSIIASVLSMVGVVSVAMINSKTTQKQIEQQNSLQCYRLECLEKKVEAHNNLVSRMYKCESDIAVIKQELADSDDGK